ncbi:sialate O-acetylesterase [Cupriavidus basilensis]|uniref:Sialate O-acetylesterase domain-containing protein n=1 Tax=Cupriavidus basilensis TaxID=68895 RepID=A0A0C4Y1A7_9BURK|nr:sialate O-acetylesterase [Cupriavidus basilensis]AJG18817.1 hypothetical protein RR42_m1416 [Cupriavidus basilensis]
MSNPLQDKVDQFIVDEGLNHQYVNGDQNTLVQTAGGPVPSIAKQAKDNDAAINAAGLLGQVNASKDAAQSAMTGAQFAMTGAQAARDGALIQAGVYVDEPTGRAAVADGQAFKVQGSGVIAAFEYRRVNSASATLIAIYPSSAAVSALQSILPSLAPSGYAWALTDAFFSAAIGVKTDGTFTAVVTDIANLVATVSRIGNLTTASSPPAGYSYAWMDSLGQMAAGITTSGSFIISNLTALLTSINQLNIGSSSVISEQSTPTSGVFSIKDGFGSTAARVNADGSVEVDTLTVRALKVTSVSAQSLAVAASTVSALMPDMPHVISYGQSLGEGVNALPPLSTVQKYNAVSFNGGVRAQDGGTDPAVTHASLIPMVETQFDTGNGVAGETPLSGMTEFIHERLVAENPGFNASAMSLLGSAPGQGSQSIANLSKGGSYYQRLLNDVSYGVSLANAASKLYQTTAITWTQGEADQSLGTSASAYITALNTLLANVNSDAAAASGQSQAVRMIMYQMGSYKALGGTYPTIAFAQRDACRQNANMFLACPMYQFDNSDAGVHLTNVSSRWLGAYYGLVYKRVVIDGLVWKPTMATSWVRQGKVALIKFNVPGGGLVFDTSYVTDPGNYGFSLVDSSGNPLTISGVSLLQNDTVKIVAATAIPAGAKWRYGWGNGTANYGRTAGPRGCLRDSMGDTIVYAGAGNQPMHNWAIVDEQILN